MGRKRKRAERVKDQGPSGPKSTSGEKESCTRHVYVEPGVQIDLVQDLKKKYETAQSDNTAHSKKILFWTIISAGLLLLYVTLTLWQSCTTYKLAKTSQQQLELDQRPWVGPMGSNHITAEIRKGSPIKIRIEIQNVGKTPALDEASFTSMTT